MSRVCLHLEETGIDHHDFPLYALFHSENNKSIQIRAGGFYAGHASLLELRKRLEKELFGDQNELLDIVGTAPSIGIVSNETEGDLIKASLRNVTLQTASLPAGNEKETSVRTEKQLDQGHGKGGLLYQPEGFKWEARRRPESQRVDVYYRVPDGRIVRCKQDVERYLLKHPDIKLSVNDFSFGLNDFIQIKGRQEIIESVVMRERGGSGILPKGKSLKGREGEDPSSGLLSTGKLTEENVAPVRKSECGNGALNDEGNLRLSANCSSKDKSNGYTNQGDHQGGGRRKDEEMKGKGGRGGKTSFWSDDEEVEILKEVQEFYLEASDGSIYPLSKVQHIIYGPRKRVPMPRVSIFLKGKGDKGLRPVYEEVAAWTVRFMNLKTKLWMLSTKGSWIELLKPHRSYQPQIRVYKVLSTALSIMKFCPSSSESDIMSKLAQRGVSLENIKKRFSLVEKYVKAKPDLEKASNLGEWYIVSGCSQPKEDCHLLPLTVKDSTAPSYKAYSVFENAHSFMSTLFKLLERSLEKNEMVPQLPSEEAKGKNIVKNSNGQESRKRSMGDSMDSGGEREGKEKKKEKERESSLGLDAKREGKGGGDSKKPKLQEGGGNRTIDDVRNYEGSLENDLDEWEGGGEEDDEEVGGDSICAICDDGGELVCCDGPCMRSFHAYVDPERDCPSLGLNVNLTGEFLCDNCKYKEHQCMVCGKLGKSTSDDGEQEVFMCDVALCGKFYHPDCVTEVLIPDKLRRWEKEEGKVGLEGEALTRARTDKAERIKNKSDLFMCPYHSCQHCGQKEGGNMMESTQSSDISDKLVPCRRCPRAWHVKCITKKMPIDGQDQRVWGVNPTDQAEGLPRFLYCLKHVVNKDTRTPQRDHLTWPKPSRRIQAPKRLRIVVDSPPHEASPWTPSGLPQIQTPLGFKVGEGKPKESREKGQEKDEEKEGRKLEESRVKGLEKDEEKEGRKLEESRVKGLEKDEEKGAKKEKGRLKVMSKVRASPTTDGSARIWPLIDGKDIDRNFGLGEGVKRGSSGGEVVEERTLPGGVVGKARRSPSGIEAVALKGKPWEMEREGGKVTDLTPKGRKPTEEEGIKSKPRKLPQLPIFKEEELMKNIKMAKKLSENLFTKENVLQSLPVVSIYGAERRLTFKMNRIKSIINAVEKADTLMENNGTFADVAAVCPPFLLKDLDRYGSYLRVYLAPFLHGARYSSYGRHFTQKEKLEEVVKRLLPYVEDGDCLVDMCCGSNDFSKIAKTYFDKAGKCNCDYRNFDIIPPKDTFNFEKKDWFRVPYEGPERNLPDGDKLIIGLNPPFGVRARLASSFAEYAGKFRPKLIILIVPPETSRPSGEYELVWEDHSLLAGKAFYLPGSLDTDNEALKQWNKTAPPLYLYCRRDLLEKYRTIAAKEGHISLPPLAQPLSTLPSFPPQSSLPPYPLQPPLQSVPQSTPMQGQHMGPNPQREWGWENRHPLPLDDNCDGDADMEIDEDENHQVQEAHGGDSLGFQSNYVDIQANNGTSQELPRELLDFPTFMSLPSLLPPQPDEGISFNPVLDKPLPLLPLPSHPDLPPPDLPLPSPLISPPSPPVPFPLSLSISLPPPTPTIVPPLSIKPDITISPLGEKSSPRKETSIPLSHPDVGVSLPSILPVPTSSSLPNLSTSTLDDVDLSYEPTNPNNYKDHRDHGHSKGHFPSISHIPTSSSLPNRSTSTPDDVDLSYKPINPNNYKDHRDHGHKDSEHRSKGHYKKGHGDHHNADRFDRDRNRDRNHRKYDHNPRGNDFHPLSFSNHNFNTLDRNSYPNDRDLRPPDRDSHIYDRDRDRDHSRFAPFDTGLPFGRNNKIPHQGNNHAFPASMPRPPMSLPPGFHDHVERNQVRRPNVDVWPSGNEEMLHFAPHYPRLNRDPLPMHHINKPVRPTPFPPPNFPPRDNPHNW